MRWVSFSSRMKMARKRKKYTLASLGDKIDLAQSTLSAYENGNREPSFEILIKICESLGISPNYLFQDDLPAELSNFQDGFYRVVEAYQSLSLRDKRIVDLILGIDHDNKIVNLADQADFIFIPTYNVPVSAGCGNFIDEAAPTSAAYPKTKASVEADFCVRVSGDSKYPTYEDQDILFVKESAEEEFGKPGIFLLRGEVYCKRCIMKEGRAVLVSDNMKYAPIEIGLSDQFKKYGDVIGKYHVD